jgi:hypothetical protein
MAAALGMNYGRLDNIIRRHLSTEYAAATEAYHARVRAAVEVGVHVTPTVPGVTTRPFEVPIAAPAPSLEGRCVTAVVKGDRHVPYHDLRFHAIVLAILSDIKPDINVDMGDLFDCSQISRWPVDPARESRLQDELDIGRTILHQEAQAAPNALRFILEGNHEARMHKVWESMGDRQGREIGKLRSIRSAMEWRNLLDLDAIGWQWIPTEAQAHTETLPKLVTMHGTTTGVRKWSTWSAKAAWERIGRSVAVGHCHRAGVALHRDHNGQAFWIETGCGCNFVQPYGSDFDWQQAITVIEWNEDRSLMQPTQIVVRDGRAMFRGREYVG